jgi:hypothetical protein
MATLPGIVQPAPSGAYGFDADTVISLDVAQQFSGQGYQFCLRYLSLGSPQATGDLSPAEALDILNGGLALMPVQHVANQGWEPSASLGQTFGSDAACNATAIGFPQGVNVWCDLEGVAGGTPAQAVIDYCNAWFDAVANAGYVPGLYVGAKAILSGLQLYNLKFQHYWQSESRVPALPHRGYQMVQSAMDGQVNGIYIDQDVTQTDSKGGQAVWLTTAAQ